MTPDADTVRLSHEILCTRIETLTTAMMGFWKSAHGWAPIEAAGLLSKSMLGWQASLSSTLRKWLHSSSNGDLILAWANLGALVEGQFKLFLSVWYNDYAADADAIRDRKGNLLDPDGCTLEPLRQFFVKRIWTVGDDWNPYVQHIQQRRNAIHAFNAREIGTFDEWKRDLRYHLSFVRDINGRLPYPDDIYMPRET
ncbi:MAG: hypothetical protein ABIL06_08215 [Pseudomonadota bacterium]